MLSILIPVYNYNITALVKDLQHQAMETAVDFEIIVLEDGSTKYLNENNSIKDLPFIKYEVLSKNIGRSAIRNYLADMAKYDSLLFLDCDAEVNSPLFIQRYLPFCKTNCVVVGGTAYDPNNNNPKYSLRLKYGRVREARTALEREKHNSFSTFNFLISSEIFKKIRFNEILNGYGHEDSLFGYELQRTGVTIYQIENSIIHKGLDENSVFLRKSREAAFSLYRLYSSREFSFLVKDSKLLQAFVRVKNWKMDYFLASIFSILQSKIEKKLSKKNPSLKLYDLYKLGFICKISRNK